MCPRLFFVKTPPAVNLRQFLDRDEDGSADLSDNCLDNFNPDQADQDGDGIGDVCDLCPQNKNLLHIDPTNNLPGNSYYESCPAPWGDSNPATPVVTGTATTSTPTNPLPSDSVKVCVQWNSASYSGTNVFEPDCYNVHFEVRDLLGNVLEPNCLLPPPYNIANSAPVDLHADYCVTCSLRERFPDLGTTVSAFTITNINYSSYVSDPWRDPEGNCVNPIDGTPAPPNSNCPKIWTGAIPITPPAGTFTISTAPPEITGYTMPVAPVSVPTAVALGFTFTDDKPGQTHTCSISADSLTITGTVNETTGTCSIPARKFPAGVYTIAASVSDSNGNTATSTATALLVVFDSSSGYVAGAGWFNSPAGAYIPKPTATGTAFFGFVSKFVKGKSVPIGDTEFLFAAGGLYFRSSNYDWLVISGSKAQYKGTGYLNGVNGYKFILTAVDGSKDKIRLKIKDSNGVVVYDNRLNLPPDDMDLADPQVIAGGNIVIRK